MTVRSFDFGQAAGTGEDDVRQRAAEWHRVLALILDQVDHAGPKGVQITADSWLARLARQSLERETPPERANRTATMVLRDLVGRADAVRTMLAERAADPAIAEVLKLLDTADVHRFLKDGLGNDPAKRSIADETE